MCVSIIFKSKKMRTALRPAEKKKKKGQKMFAAKGWAAGAHRPARPQRPPRRNG